MIGVCINGRFTIMQEFVFLGQASFSRATWRTGASVLYEIPQSCIWNFHTQLVKKSISALKPAVHMMHTAIILLYIQTHFIGLVTI